MLNISIIIFLVIVGVHDLFLYLTGKETMSERYQKLLPTAVDLVIFVALFIALCFANFIDCRVRMAIVGILSHLMLPNRERYGEKNS